MADAAVIAQAVQAATSRKHATFARNNARHYHSLLSRVCSVSHKTMWFYARLPGQGVVGVSGGCRN